MPNKTGQARVTDPLETGATSDLIGYRLRRAQLSVFQRFLAVFDELKLRPAEYSVLVLIADNPGRKQTADRRGARDQARKFRNPGAMALRSAA